MTPGEHYAEAERLLVVAREHDDPMLAASIAAEAQGHAVLATVVMPLCTCKHHATGCPLDHPAPPVRTVEQCSICGHPEAEHTQPWLSHRVMALHAAASLQGMDAFERIPMPTLGDPDATVPGEPEFIP